MLQDKTVEELRVIAANLSLQVHHKSGKETLINAIAEKMMTPPAPQEMIHKAEAEAEPVHHNTKEDVLKAIKPFTDKEGFTAEFLDDGTWFFKYKGAEESGNMSIPLRVIRLKAEGVSKGARRMKSMGRDGTYGNSYADTILM